MDVTLHFTVMLRQLRFLAPAAAAALALPSTAAADSLSSSSGRVDTVVETWTKLSFPVVADDKSKVCPWFAAVIQVVVTVSAAVLRTTPKSHQLTS